MNSKIVFLMPMTLFVAGSAFGSGFALLEQSAFDLGKAFAGTAVNSDATGQFSNPATLAITPSNAISLVGSGLNNSTSFHNENSQAAYNQSLGSNSGNAGHTHFIPADFVTYRVSPSVVLGLSLTSPFGLSLDYGDQTIERFQALHSSIKTINFNPALGIQLTPTVSLGAGVSYQYMTSELTSSVNYSAVIAQALPSLVSAGTISSATAASTVGQTANLTGYSKISGHDSTYGFNVGVLWAPSERLSVGAAYRSRMHYNVRGDAEFGAPLSSNAVGNSIVNAVSSPGGRLSNGPVSLGISLPASATLSGKLKIGSADTFYADLAWTQWSSIKELRVVRDDGDLLSSTIEDWRDAWRFAIGGNHTFNSQWQVRAGLAYDQTPVSDATRNPRLPDNARYWATVGFTCSVSSKVTLDGGYAYLYEKHARIHTDAGNSAAYGLVDGRQQTQVNTLSLQLNYLY